MCESDRDHPRCAASATRRHLITRGAVLGCGMLVGFAGESRAPARARAPAATRVRAAGRDQVVDPPPVYARSAWGARPPRVPAAVLNCRPDHIVIHHTATSNTRDSSVEHAFALSRWIQDLHMDDRHWNDIGEHFTVSRGGVVMEGRNRTLPAVDAGVLVVGAHTKHHNTHTIGIENEGTYLSATPPEALWSGLVQVCAWLCSRYALDPYGAIVGHRDYNDTACPGDALYALLPVLRANVAEAMVGHEYEAAERPTRPGDPPPEPR